MAQEQFNHRDTLPFGYVTAVSLHSKHIWKRKNLHCKLSQARCKKSFQRDSVTENNATGAFQAIIAGLWSNTAA
jgi:hypothetical protein